MKSFPSLFRLLLAWQVACLSVVQAAVGMSKPLRFVDILNQQQSHEELVEDTIVISDVQSLTVTQRLDHFEPSTHKFQQRYFYSDRFVKDCHSKQQYAFLCVGGEGPSLTPAVLVDSVHCTGDMLELAEQLHQDGHSVHLFALEHRYYGKSYPEFVNDKNESISPVTNQNLVYLSSRQALADLAHFVEHMMKPTDPSDTPNPLPDNTLWVTFGGSYPGMLAGWARLKYPHLIHAAVSNSAPIQAKLDMNEYNDRVAWDLQYPEVGGSKECQRIFEEGHQQIAKMTETQPGRQVLAKAFNFCDEATLEHKENVQSWLGDGVLFVPAQSNDPSCDDDFCNIEQLCNSISKEQQTNSSKPAWQILKDLASQQQADQCLTVDWQKTLDYIKDPGRGQPGGLRSWLWQTCTEFGFYQTCEADSHCPYAKGFHNLDLDFQICQYAFGIEREQVIESIQQTHEYYGDKQLKGGSRILSVNGNVDPWSTLARDNDTSNSDDPLLPTYQVEGASHHFWTHPVQDSDSPFVTKARQFIYRVATNWLGLEEATSVPEENLAAVN